jgi:uncharacterized protein (TIGR02452 family)
MPSSRRKQREGRQHQDRENDNDNNNNDVPSKTINQDRTETINVTQLKAVHIENMKKLTDEGKPVLSSILIPYRMSQMIEAEVVRRRQVSVETLIDQLQVQDNSTNPREPQQPHQQQQQQQQQPFVLPSSRWTGTEICMLMGTTQEAAQYYYEIDHEPPVILSFASNRHVGGGITKGSNGQEESLCRTIPDLYPSLLTLEKEYPWSGTSIIFTPNVTIQRHHETHEWLETPIPVHVVSASAPNMKYAKLTQQEHQLQVQDMMRNIIVSPQTYLPIDRRPRTLILGPLGCGQYKNDPYLICDYMCQVVKQFGGSYKRVVFALPHTVLFWNVWCDVVVKHFKRISPPSFLWLDEGPDGENHDDDDHDDDAHDHVLWG